MGAFLRNAWYAAAWQDELRLNEMLPRRFLGDPVVMFRRGDGSPAALADICPHRFAPLSMGRLDGDGIECAYHGLRFDCSGSCTRNPHGDGKIPPRARVRTYPLVERFGLIWIWMGDPARAEGSELPEFDFLSDPEFQNVHGYTYAHGHYELMTDNLLDLGHIEFLHPGLLGSDAVRRAHVDVRQQGNTVVSKRRTEREALPAFLRVWYQAGDGNVSRWLDVRWDPPALMKLSVGVLPDGAPASAARESQGCHLLTPADDSATHYFWAQGRNWGSRDPEMDLARLNSLKTAFDTQDKPMIEAIQRNMGNARFEDMAPVMLSVDGGPVRARRVLTRLIAEEQASAGTSRHPLDNAMAAS